MLITTRVLKLGVFATLRAFCMIFLHFFSHFYFRIVKWSSFLVPVRGKMRCHSKAMTSRTPDTSGQGVSAMRWWGWPWTARWVWLPASSWRRLRATRRTRTSWSPRSRAPARTWREPSSCTSACARRCRRDRVRVLPRNNVANLYGNCTNKLDHLTDGQIFFLFVKRPRFFK